MRRVLTLSMAAVMLAGIWSGGSFASAAGPAKPTPAKIDSKVLAQIAVSGQTTFFVLLKDKADVSRATSIKDWGARGKFVFDQLRQKADATQASLRSMLSTRRVSYRTYWIVNAIRVTGNQQLVNELAAQPEVDQILPDKTYQIPKPIKGKSGAPGIQTVEWNINDINAPLVWNTYGDRGEGITVGSIDTGVQWDHPALINQYRGHHADGTVDHNYNWFDPENICGNPSNAPCDNVFHGTHTMGTMIGDDGNPGTNQIGVAPHATWMTAKGCETTSCSLDALLRSGQWMLAPTDLSGSNPRPDLRPAVINNSWGDGPNDPFYQQTVDNWIAAGIFPDFANGNAGPSCNSAGVPGAYPESEGVGAYDIGHNIAFFSSRGPSAFNNTTKPDISAPGVNVRSSVPGNGYDSFSGTSMATPHVAGTIALIWSAAPTLYGDIAGTRALLASTAVQTSDLSCGGTSDFNNVWGHGRLDAFAAVTAAPRGPTGTLAGIVTDSATASPISGATVQAAGPTTRSTTTGADGSYSMLLPVGSYNVTASNFGYVTQTVNGVVVSQDATTTQNFALVAAPHHSLSGTVRDDQGNGVANGTVTILGTPIPAATTDATGHYSFASVPDGEYDVKAQAGRCDDAQTQHLSLSGNATLDFSLPLRHDNFGYFCVLQPLNYVNATTPLALSGDDNVMAVTLPFAFDFYEHSYTTANVCTNGHITFDPTQGFCNFFNDSIPSGNPPNNAIYPFWDDLFVDGSASMWTQTDGSPPSAFTIEWRNVAFFGDFTDRVNFEVTLYANGRILTQYTNVGGTTRQQGDSATIGIENAGGTDALQYSFNEAVIPPAGFGILFRLPPSAIVSGHVTDANDHNAIAGASVDAVEQGGPTMRHTATDANGAYRLKLFLGTYQVSASQTNYETGTATKNLTVEDAVYPQDFALRTARAVLDQASLQIIVPADQQRHRTLTLSNTGSLPLNYQIRETGGGAAAGAVASGLNKNPSYNPNSVNTRGIFVQDTPAGWTPQSPGQVIRSWPATGQTLAWGVGYTGNVWISDPIPGGGLCGPSATCHNTEYSTAGSQTGRQWPANWANAWNADMAYDAAHNRMCQVNVGGDNGIYCWDPSTGNVVGSITGSFPWSQISQRGLAYKADDDTFFIGGWNQGILYHVKGLSYPDPGAIVDQCNTPDPNISGLAYNPAFGIVWEATNSPTDTIYELNPATCAVITTLAHPNPGFNGGGLEMDEAGNLWMVSQNTNTVYLVDSGVPAFTDVPWLSESPSSGTVAVGASQAITISVDTTGMTPGTYSATLFVQSNSGRQPSLRVPVKLIVPAYETGVDTGSTSAYTDVNQDTWAKDQQYTTGSWGWITKGTTDTTKSPIAGTVDQKLYQSDFRGMTEYRFDNLPNGVYQVELRFAELQNIKANQRVFDVVINNTLVLPALDVVGEVGKLTADDKSFFVTVTDGTMHIRLITRKGFREPIINAIRVTHRPDRAS